MSKDCVYIDGKLIPKENIESVKVQGDVIYVELIYPDKKERLYTDSTIRRIKLSNEEKYGS